MSTIYTTLKNKKDFELKILDDKILSAISAMPTDLSSYFENFLFNGAKRLRPLFMFFVCDLLNIKIKEEIINFAAGIELMHSASLIHDDILDNATKRRNTPCIHLEKGCKTAVLAGDYLLFLAMDFLLKTNCPPVLKTVSNTGYTMVKSEIASLANRFKKSNLENYIKTSKEKTSSLFCAIVKGVSQIEDIKIDDEIYSFAENFSLIFQIKDDINNFLNKDKTKTASDKEIGLSTLADFLKNDNTCDIIGEMKTFIKNLISKTSLLIKKYPKNEDLLLLLDLLEKE